MQYTGLVLLLKFHNVTVLVRIPLTIFFFQPSNTQAYWYCFRSEYLYVIFELIVGLITFATVLGIIANIVTNVSAARKDFQGMFPILSCYKNRKSLDGRSTPTPPVEFFPAEFLSHNLLLILCRLIFCHIFNV